MVDAHRASLEQLVVALRHRFECTLAPRLLAWCRVRVGVGVGVRVRVRVRVKGEGEGEGQGPLPVRW